MIERRAEASGGSPYGRPPYGSLSMWEPLGEEEALCSCTWASLLSLSIENVEAPYVGGSYVEAPV